MSVNGKIERGLVKLKLINSKFMGACPARWAENADVREEIMLAKKSLEKPVEEISEDLETEATEEAKEQARIANAKPAEKALNKMNRDELVAKAESLNLKVADDDTKAIIVEKIEEAK